MPEKLQRLSRQHNSSSSAASHDASSTRTFDDDALNPQTQSDRYYLNPEELQRLSIENRSSSSAASNNATRTKDPFKDPVTDLNIEDLCNQAQQKGVEHGRQGQCLDALQVCYQIITDNHPNIPLEILTEENCIKMKEAYTREQPQFPLLRNPSMPTLQITQQSYQPYQAQRQQQFQQPIPPPPPPPPPASSSFLDLQKYDEEYRQYELNLQQYNLQKDPLKFLEIREALLRNTLQGKEIRDRQDVKYKTPQYQQSTAKPTPPKPSLNQSREDFATNQFLHKKYVEEMYRYDALQERNAKQAKEAETLKASIRNWQKD